MKEKEIKGTLTIERIIKRVNNQDNITLNIITDGINPDEAIGLMERAKRMMLKKLEGDFDKQEVKPNYMGQNGKRL